MFYRAWRRGWWPGPVPLGISLGKSQVDPASRRRLTTTWRRLRLLYPYGDYFAVNVSSPNTPGLRSLQDRAHLAELLAESARCPVTCPTARRPSRCW